MLQPSRGLMARVQKAAYVDPSAQVIGGVDLGGESSVWISVVLRGDVRRIAIGRRALTDAEVASIRDYADRSVGYRLDYMQQV